MGGLNPGAGGGAVVVERTDGVVPLLADVACCQVIPEVAGHLEPSTEPTLLPGHVLDGRFLIREAVSRGGMATVYRAEDLEEHRREVAVKVPLRRLECDLAGFARFRHEEEIGLRLSHPLILRFYPPPEEKSRPYLVAEFLRGCTLGHLARHARPVTEADALKLIATVCSGLSYLHGAGIIHRDLKPTNLMICRDRTLRIMDFGLASAPLRQRSVLAGLAPIFGAPEYMAPEQVTNGPIDERTDLYAAGVMLYELLTGVVPFEHEDQWESAFQRTSGDPIAPRALNPAISPQAEEIVLHALQREPGDRYQTAAAFRADLLAPERVVVTGYSTRLKRPQWRLSMHGTPILAGLLLGFGGVLVLVIAFVVIAFGFKHR